MVKRVGTVRSKTRDKLHKHPRLKGKISLTRFFQKLDIGDRVCLKAEPGYQKGMYHPRYHGHVGVLVGKKGRCYEVQIRDGGMEKTLVVHPVHFQRIK
jgi:large subunit ribosomal protein L21e